MRMCILGGGALEMAMESEIMMPVLCVGGFVYSMWRGMYVLCFEHIHHQHLRRDKKKRRRGAGGLVAVGEKICASIHAGAESILALYSINLPPVASAIKCALLS